MAINTITQFLDNLYTTTWQNRMEGMADNIFNATPFYFWMKDKGKYIPNPATWLNQKRWRDELPFVKDQLNLEYWKSIL